MASEDTETEPSKIFNIKKGICKVDGQEMFDVGEDGFGITPGAEASLIKGLQGEAGFNIDPSSSAEATLSLTASSPSNAYLRNIIDKQRTGDQPPVSFEISVTTGFESAFGFTRKGMPFAVIVDYPEFKTEGKEAPQYEYKFVGYKYFEE